MAPFLNGLISIIDKGVEKLLGQGNGPRRAAADMFNDMQEKER
jgi:hypothetical protein